MRQGLFAVLLILAAFGGGALVNGPGLDWVRDQLAGGGIPGVAKAAGRDASATEAADGVPIPVVSEAESARAPERGPDSPPPPLPVAQKSPFASPAETSGAGSAGSGDANAFPSVRAPRGPSFAIAATPGEPSGSEDPDGTSRGSPLPPPSLLDAARSRLSDGTTTQVSDRPTAPTSPSPQPPEAGPSPRGGDAAAPAAAWSDATDSAAPAQPVLPEAGMTPDAGPRPAPGRDFGVRLANNPGELASSAGVDDWVAAQRRMEELGVGRFWVEGEFGGPVVFRCVVPVVGDRAVSQHFEAEGDDLLSAARDAVRRIALWKATGETP